MSIQSAAGPHHPRLRGLVFRPTACGSRHPTAHRRDPRPARHSARVRPCPACAAGRLPNPRRSRSIGRARPAGWTTGRPGRASPAGFVVRVARLLLRLRSHVLGLVVRLIGEPIAAPCCSSCSCSRSGMPFPRWRSASPTGAARSNGPRSRPALPLRGDVVSGIPPGRAGCLDRLDRRCTARGSPTWRARERRSSPRRESRRRAKPGER
jgi:hypothetical protein